MKNWRQYLDVLESNYEWRSSIALFEEIEGQLKDEDRLDLTVRVLFLTTFSLLEGIHTTQEVKVGEQKMKSIFDDNMKRYSYNPDFLFCISVITRLNEYAFNLDLSIPDEYLHRSISLSPEIKLYHLWELFMKKQSLTLNNYEYLTSKFVSQWRLHKGILGDYVIDLLLNKFSKI